MIQFQNTSGAFKAKFTDKKVIASTFWSGTGSDEECQVNYANGLVFGTHTETSHLYVTGPYAGKVIVKFDQNNGEHHCLILPSSALAACGPYMRVLAGTYIEHFEDRDIQYPLGMVYYEQA